jgi:hypothetical protein
VRLEQFQKACEPMEVTEDGIVIEVRPVQLWKALAPIEVTEDGIVIEVILLLFAKALAAIPVTLRFLGVPPITIEIVDGIAIFVSEASVRLITWAPPSTS